MKRKTFLCMALLALVTGACAMAQDTHRVMPEDLDVGIFLRLRKEDSGAQWFLDAAKKSALLQALGEEAQAIVEDFSLVDVEEISVGIKDALAESPRLVIVADIIPVEASVSFKIKDMDFKLNIKERSDQKGLQPAVVRALLSGIVAAEDRAEGADGITHSPTLEENGKMSAYAILESRVILSNRLRLAEHAVRGTREEGPAALPAELSAFLEQLYQPHDLLVFLNNGGGLLADINARLEMKRQIPILMGVDSIRCAGVFVNIMDEDRAEVQADFILDEAVTPGMKGDLAFLFEFFRRKLLKQDIRSEVHLSEGPNLVRVRMQLSNIGPMADRLFKRERKASEGEVQGAAGVQSEILRPDGG